MPDDNSSGNTPAADQPPVTSPASEQTPSQPSTEENVILSKEEHAQLTRDAAITKTAQQNASGLQSKLDALLRRKVAPLPPLEAQAVATVKNQVASALIVNSKYAPLLQKNPLLAKVLAKNPLDLLDQDEFIDEQDATNQVLDFLDAEIAKEVTVEPAPSPVPSAPAPQATNPDEVQPTDTPSEKELKEQRERNASLPPIQRVEKGIASRLNIS